MLRQGLLRLVGCRGGFGLDPRHEAGLVGEREEAKWARHGVGEWWLWAAKVVVAGGS
jgi:hypothetical protein